MLIALRRYRSFVVVVAAVAVIALLPGQGDDDADEATGLASTQRRAAGVGGAVDQPAAAGFAGAASGRAGASAVPGGGSAPGGAGGIPPVTEVNGFPGIGSAEALASPRCDRERQRVRWPSLYNPPCARPWPKGASNGGATAQGVSADKIKVVVYYGPRAAQDRSRVPDQRFHEVIRNLLNMFAVAYESYGRRFDIVFFEASGEDEVAQRADAIQIGNLKPFLAFMPDFTKVRRVWAADLAARGVIVWTPTLTTAEATQRPGYRWGAGPDDRLHALLVGEYVGKRLYGLPAKWAGDAPQRLQTRKFGLLYDEAWDPKTFAATLQRYRPGAVVVDAVSHDPQADITSLQEAAQVHMARFKSKGINNVIAVTGIFPTVFYTQAATSQSYFPEWTVTGWGQSDNAVTGKLYEPTQWRNASGVGMVPVFLTPTTDVEYYYQYNWVYDEALSSAEQGFASQVAALVFPMAIGIHMAGPALSMDTFRAGMFAVPPIGGRWCGCVSGAGAVGFGRHLDAYSGDKYSMFEDITEKWWDPNTVGSDEIGLTAPGVWRFVNGGKRYVPGEFPSGEPSMFTTDGTVTTVEGYDNLPPNDRYPRYDKPSGSQPQGNGGQ